MEKPVQEIERIDCIMDAVNPYKEYEAYKNYFLSPELELVVSNTTEAGIARVDNEDIHALPPKSFPGKVCQLLYQRYRKFDGAPEKGLTFFCCELIDKNASKLREIVLELAAQNNLEQGFIDWINKKLYILQYFGWTELYRVFRKIILRKFSRNWVMKTILSLLENSFTFGRLRLLKQFVRSFLLTKQA